MKHMISVAVSVLVMTVLMSYLPVSGENEIYENTVRLHVIAASDSERDQALKLKVRDSILEYVSKISEDGGKETVEASLEASLEEIEAVAEKTLSENGCNKTVTAVLGEEKYPMREYDNFILPAGIYTSLRVVIGEGSGKNWWCVLYPPLCNAVGEKECEENFISAGFTSEQYKMIKKDSGGKYKVRFKVLEILSEAFGFDY